MEKLTKKEKIFLGAVLFYITYNAFPLFSSWLNLPVEYPSLFVSIIIIILYPKSLISSPIKWLLLYLSFMTLYALFGHVIFINGLDNRLPASWRIIIESAWITPAVAIFCALNYINKRKIYKIVGYGSVIILVVSLIYILPTITSLFNILRKNMESMGDEKLSSLPGYALMHAYTLMIIPLFVAIKKTKKILRFFAVASLILLLYVITQTAITTSLFVAVLCILFISCYRAKSKYKSIIFFVILAFIVYFLYVDGFFLQVTDWLMPFFDETAVSNKLNDIHRSLVNETIQGGSITGRINLHNVSIGSFWANPLFGNGFVGGHSKILDILGGMGLCVFIPFIMIIITPLKYYIKKLNDEFSVYIIATFACAGIFLYEKGIFDAEGWLFMLVIAPSSLLSFFYEEKSNKMD